MFIHICGYGQQMKHQYGSFTISYLENILKMFFLVYSKHMVLCDTLHNIKYHAQIIFIEDIDSVHLFL